MHIYDAYRSHITDQSEFKLLYLISTRFLIAGICLYFFFFDFLLKFFNLSSFQLKSLLEQFSLFWLKYRLVSSSIYIHTRTTSYFVHSDTPTLVIMSNSPHAEVSPVSYKINDKTLNHKNDSVSNSNFHNSGTPASSLPPLPPPLPRTKDNLFPAPMSQAVLNRLEVESTSTKSLPISFPYYFLDQEDPQDTFHLLRSETDSVVQSPDEKDLPLPPAPQTSQTKGASTRPHNPSEQNMVKTYNEFNPKRFSHFIVDEQNPHISQRLDNLSIVSPSLESAGHEIMRSLTPMQKNTRNSELIMNPDRHHHHLGRAEVLSTPTRDISDSMGSQATIFSTRQDTPILTRGEYNRKKASSLLFNRKSKRTSNVRVQTSSSSDSSLTRRNAIKFKQGSWLYRLKMSIKKMISKFKFYSFKVSSKRSPSVKRSGTLQSLRRRRENPQPRDIKRIKSIRAGSSPFNISAPVNNPQLGKQPVFKVARIDDVLKYRAGSPNENMNLYGIDESVGKMNHLSEYIYQQEADYFKKHGINNSMNIANSGEKNSDSKSMLPSPNFDESPSEFLTDSVTTHAKSNPPIPPPHLDHSFTASRNLSPQRFPAPAPSPATELDHQNIVELWEKYLRLVLYKRIQLRQEINMFQNFMVSEFASTTTTNDTNKIQSSHEPVSYHHEQSPVQCPQAKSITTSSTNNGSSVYTDMNTLQIVKSMAGERSIVKSNSTSERTNTYSEKNSDNASVYTSTSLESNDVINNKDEEFATKVLNRRSMLGEMLEYLSEDDDDNDDIDDDELSINKSNSIVSKQSDLVLKTYGTVLRRGSSKLNSSLKRSFGLNHSLSSIAANE